jgi:hypothetical protein
LAKASSAVAGRELPFRFLSYGHLALTSIGGRLAGAAIRIAQDVGLSSDSTAVRYAFASSSRCNPQLNVFHGQRSRESRDSPKSLVFLPETRQVRLLPYEVLPSVLTHPRGSLLSTLRCHPPMIRHHDYTIPLPSIDEPEEHAQWRMHPALRINTSVGQSQYSTPSVKACAMSSFCASSLLSSMGNSIVARLYSIRPWPIEGDPLRLHVRSHFALASSGVKTRLIKLYWCRTPFKKNYRPGQLLFLRAFSSKIARLVLLTSSSSIVSIIR